MRNLDDVPDKTRLGVNLVIVGSILIAAWYYWPRVAPASFEKASAVFAAVGGWSPTSLADTIVWAGAISTVYGLFIFFRRGVWWWQERQNERNITQLKFK
ncbi:MAG: hypothetical protein ACLQMT_11035 [Candidatus Acidiferrales bacterium]